MIPREVSRETDWCLVRQNDNSKTIDDIERQGHIRERQKRNWGDGTGSVRSYETHHALCWFTWHETDLRISCYVTNSDEDLGKVDDTYTTFPNRCHWCWQFMPLFIITIEWKITGTTNIDRKQGSSAFHKQEIKYHLLLGIVTFINQWPECETNFLKVIRCFQSKGIAKVDHKWYIGSLKVWLSWKIYYWLYSSCILFIWKSYYFTVHRGV